MSGACPPRSAGVRGCPPQSAFFKRSCSPWSDTDLGIEAAVAAPRVHVVPDRNLYLEGRAALAPDSLNAYRFTLVTPSTDLMIEERNAYFGGVHAVAWENGRWVGAADPRRDGAVRIQAADRDGQGRAAADMPAPAR